MTRIYYAVGLVLTSAVANASELSATNLHLRICHDTLWLVTFGLMISVGHSWHRISDKALGLGWRVLTATAVVGCVWKMVTLVQLILGRVEPAWFFVQLPYTLEMLTALTFALAIILLTLMLRQAHAD